MKDIAMSAEMLIEYLLRQGSDETNTSKEVEIESPVKFQEAVDKCILYKITNEGFKKRIHIGSDTTIIALYDVSPCGSLTVKLEGYFTKVALSFVIDVIIYNI